MASLEGKRVVVTGAGRGIGRALAGGFAEAGARVVLAGRDLGALEAAAAEIGLGSMACRLDVRDVAGMGTTIEAVTRRLEGLDVLVNNAGVEEVCPALDVDEALWDRIHDTNLKGAFFCAQAAARAMPDGGAILNLCSLTSKVGVATAVPYGASKSGLAGMTRALAVEWAARGIRVNGLGPGYFRTNMTDGFFADDGWRERTLAGIPMRRFGRMEDLVGPALFLCSDAAGYVTGQILYVDGGMLAAI